jgi:hypothetical protein
VLRVFQSIVLVIVCLVAGTCFGQSKPERESLCDLQGKIAEGDHVSVTVSGIYGPGLDRTVLVDSSCATEFTWVELDLTSERNQQKLRRLIDRSRQAYVVVAGVFFGPPLPDPKLPEAIRKNYHPGWGHLGAFKTKFVVHVIRSVAVVPSGKL